MTLVAVFEAQWNDGLLQEALRKREGSVREEDYLLFIQRKFQALPIAELAQGERRGCCDYDDH